MNEGHGWVRVREDGLKAKCGGPNLCPQCAREAAAARIDMLADQPPGYARRGWQVTLFAPPAKAMWRGSAMFFSGTPATSSEEIEQDMAYTAHGATWQDVVERLTRLMKADPTRPLRQTEEVSIITVAGTPRQEEDRC